jgi:DNA polymerase-3 subunit epsilon
MPAALPEETEIVLSWLEQPGVRLVAMDGGSWASPVGGAAAARTRLEAAVRDVAPRGGIRS